MTGKKNALKKLLNKFRGAGDEVGISCRITAPTTSYALYQHLGRRKYLRIEMLSANPTAGQEVTKIYKVSARTYYRGYNDTTTPAVIFPGGAWTCAANEIDYPGGRIFYTGTVGRYAQVTLPATTTWVGASFNPQATSTGVCKVTIDGDATLADLLPTAQDLVDAGTLPNTVLVANGGTLNPTDRVFNQYNLPSNYTDEMRPTANAHVELFSTSLPAGAHVVRIYLTGYKQAEATFSNIACHLIIGGDLSKGILTDGTAENCFLNEQEIEAISPPPIWEISWSMKPQGAAGTEWLGHSGSQKYINPPGVKVDGVDTVMVHGQFAKGTNLTIEFQAGGRHTEIDGGATDVATVEYTYTLDAATGLTIAHTTTWLMNGTASGFPCMLMIDHAVFDRFRTLGSVATDLTDNDNGVHCNTRKAAAYAWDSDGYVGALMYIPDLNKTVENWEHAGTNQLWWADIAADGGIWKKAYAMRFDPAVNFADGTTWQSEANYRGQWFPSGANGALA